MTELWINPSSRSNNDADNKIREQHLINLNSNHTPEFKFLRNSFKKLIYDLSPTCKMYKITPLGGRGNHIDFKLITLDKNKDTVGNFNLELKCVDTTKISGLPQIADVSEKKREWIKNKYIKFYYDNYLDKYIKTDPELPNKPSWEDYYKEVYNIKRETDFFKILKERWVKGKFSYNEKNEIINQSIQHFMENEINNFNVKLLFDFLKDTQLSKTFVIWSRTNKKFFIDGFSPKHFIEKPISHIKNGNTYVIGKFTINLVWKNTKGIQNPAWKIKYKD